MKQLLILLAVLLTTTAFAEAQTPAFPDAEGGGMWTSGARGCENPEVYHVTNLNDSGEGSFRAAVSKGNRFIVFDVSGNITLNSRINIREDNITILGQSAPGEGISIDGEGIVITGNNIIMRYLRVRRGEGITEGDSLWINRCRDVIIDHCSFCWSVDECVSFTYAKNVTVQWSIIAESLNSSTHSKGAHGYGGIWGGINTGGHHNLISSNRSRNPRIGSGAGVDGTNPDTDGLVNVRNNVIYNWGSASAYGGENGMRANFIGNYYKPGPASVTDDFIYSLTGTTADSTSLPENGGTTGAGAGRLGWSTTLFADGNYLEGNAEVSADNRKGIKVDYAITDWKWCESISDGIYVDGALKANDEYLNEYPFITHDAMAAYDEVIKYAGASIKRDAIDTRIVSHVTDGTAPTGSVSGYGLIDTPDDVGGFVTIEGSAKERDSDGDGITDSAEEAFGLDYNVFDSLTIAADGYTMLEKYCETLAVHEGMVKADKSKLKEKIYSAQRMDKYGYTKASWNNMQAMLEEAEETAAIVYAPQTEIDAAAIKLEEAISALETDPKYDLRVILDEANAIDSALYTMDSYLMLMNTITEAKKVYADTEFVKEEVDNAIALVRNAVDSLVSYYGYQLNELIEKVYKINQSDYTYDSMNTLVTILREAESLSGTTDNELLRTKYEELDAAYAALVKETNANSRFKGNFEDFVSFGLNRGYYGSFSIGTGDSTVEIAENIGSNPTKAVVFKDTAANRTSLVYSFPEKLSGVFDFEGDFYFEEKPNTHNILLRLTDNDLETANYMTLLLKASGSGAFMRLQYFDETIDFKNAVIGAQKWYHVRVIFDTDTKAYHIRIDGKKAADGTFSDTTELGITSYAIATPGGSTQTMAADNLTAELIKNPTIVGYEFTEATDKVQFTGDIAGCGNEGARLILASYTDGRLVDAVLTDIAADTEVSAAVTAGDTVKAFLWTNEMEPIAAVTPQL